VGEKSTERHVVGSRERSRHRLDRVGQIDVIRPEIPSLEEAVEKFIADAKASACSSVSASA
jgi:hypothetical protein